MCRRGVPDACVCGRHSKLRGRHANDLSPSCNTWILPKNGKKKFDDAQIAQKKFPTTVTQTEDFFFSLQNLVWEKNRTSHTRPSNRHIPFVTTSPVFLVVKISMNSHNHSFLIGGWGVQVGSIHKLTSCNHQIYT